MSFAGRLGWRAHARGWALVAVVASSGLAPAAAHAHDAVSPPVCDELAAAAWPRTAADRRALLQRLEAARETCKDHPAFLAVLGGNWLEDGNLEQALLWLERALMLDPALSAAQADYALALLALGDPTARNDLLLRWAQRSDIPPLVWLRLQRSGSGGPGQAGGEPSTNSRWAQIREIGLFAGHESNLDRSPRLTELTLTPPDGPVDLPLAQPIQPRPGTAAVADLSWQVAYSPRPGSLLQFGVIGTARSAPAHPETDWNHLQLAASAGQRWGGWRALLQGSVSRFGGRLSEPYRLQRWGVSLERSAFGCSHRLALESETRTQQQSAINDSRSGAALWSSTCPLPFDDRWAVGLALRTGYDDPRDKLRPGGAQRQNSLGLRVAGPLPHRWRADLTLRYTQVDDLEGYSPLLENNLKRITRPLQFGIELARPTDEALLHGADYVLQLQGIRQTSNLPLFAYTSVAAFGGLRWRW